jgi:hypothetical protein
MRVIAASRISLHLIQIFASHVVFIIDGVGQIDTNFGGRIRTERVIGSSPYLIDTECAPVH